LFALVAAAKAGGFHPIMTPIPQRDKVVIPGAARNLSSITTTPDAHLSTNA
jgi:hypothetical protein